MSRKKQHLMKQYGFNLELEKSSQSEEDWVGGTLPDLASIPVAERFDYLPKGERQNIGDEKMDCASRGPLNVLETKFNWLIWNKKLSFEHKPSRKGDVKHTLADISNAREFMGYEVKTRFKEGLNKTFEWFKDTGNR